MSEFTHVNVITTIDTAWEGKRPDIQADEVTLICRLSLSGDAKALCEKGFGSRRRTRQAEMAARACDRAITRYVGQLVKSIPGFLAFHIYPSRETEGAPALQETPKDGGKLAPSSSERK